MQADPKLYIVATVGEEVCDEQRTRKACLSPLPPSRRRPLQNLPFCKNSEEVKSATCLQCPGHQTRFFPSWKRV